MTIESDKYGEFNIECSLCEDIEELPEAGSFYEAVEEAKRAKWSVRIHGGEWIHICPQCKGNLQ